MRRTPVLLVALLTLALPGIASAKGPTVAAELSRLQADGSLDAATSESYKNAYAEARRTLKKLHGFRRAQLRAVIGNVDALAARRQFIPSRLKAEFLTLQRNRAWWAAAPIPYAGERKTFPPSQVVWQFYPGQGWQIQWLGTFGKANALWMVRTRDADLRRLLDEVLGLATQRAGGIAFEYLFTFDGGRPPWVSGLAQGTGLSALSRGAVRLKDTKYFDAARTALGIFRTPPPAGVAVRTAAGTNYLQYSYAPRLTIVNGFTQSLNGLHDFATLANDADGRALFSAGEAQLRSVLPAFDTGAWSLYSKPGAESDLGYHRVLRDFLTGLCDRLKDDRTRGHLAQVEAPPSGSDTTVPDPRLYCDTAADFTADLHTRPKLTLTPPTRPLRAKRDAHVDYTLDKVSTVTITATRAGRLVLSRSARLGRGRHADLAEARAGRPADPPRRRHRPRRQRRPPPQATIHVRAAAPAV